MDAFIIRKKRKLSPSPGHDQDDEPTDVKLAMLSSLHPDLPQDTLLESLLAHDGSVSETSASLRQLKPARKTSGVMGAQSSLKHFGMGSASDAPLKKKLLSKRGATLHLYDPADIAEHTPCTIIHNFLPPDQADDLLKELLGEAETYVKESFKLFDNVVSSPHTSSFYVESFDEVAAQKTEYHYNGARLSDVRRLTPQLEKAKPIVQEAVNREIQMRVAAHYPGGKKLRFQSPGPWAPNFAFVNCYDGPQESVGWHSDQMTYLGPRAVIGSISLGVAREFRVRKIIPKAADKASKPEDSDAEGQIAIHLPHNSLLVMHAEMQEEWKHTIAPAQSIDPHPIAGNKRINITYRDYKASLHPRHTPRCDCDVPCVLRVVQRKIENHGRYFWMCYAGNIPGKESCPFFQWARFDDDGNPIWTQTKRPTKG